MYCCCSWFDMLCCFYDWILCLVGYFCVELVLGGVIFVESLFFLILLDVLLVLMVLVNWVKVWCYVMICVISLVLGGIVGYFIGLLLFESVVMLILVFYGLLENFEQVVECYNELGWLMVLLGGGFMLLLYKVIIIISGVIQFDFWLFVGFSFVVCSLCFVVICVLLFWVGLCLKILIEWCLGMVFVLMVVMVVGGLMLGKYVF